LIKITAALDRPTPQVLVEARVLEITLSDDFEFGIKHTFTNLAGESRFLQGAEIELKAPGPSPTVDQGLSLLLRPLATDRERLDVALRMLYKEGRAKILSAPSQIVEVGHEANLITGEEVPIFASTVTGGSTTVSTEFKPVGVKLQVTPLRVSGDTIELEVNPEVSAVTGSSQGPEGSTAPIVASRSTRTTLRLKDAQILSIAGLMRNDVFNDVNKIPVLGDLPIVGPLFRSVRERYTRTQLVFLLRVHILDVGEPWTIRTHAPGEGLEPLDDEFEKRVDELKAIDESRKKQQESAKP
jgi:type II secretory pathway component GspD/PulD (secretin)